MKASRQISIRLFILIPDLICDWTMFSPIYFRRYSNVNSSSLDTGTPQPILAVLLAVDRLMGLSWRPPLGMSGTRPCGIRSQQLVHTLRDVY